MSNSTSDEPTATWEELDAEYDDKEEEHGQPQQQVEVKTKRRPIPRKGHTKSRRGCFNCKRRKIKCQEERPECGHCKKSGLKCEYPMRHQWAHERSNELSDQALEQVVQKPAQLVVQISDTPGTFSLSDMKLFHHFLIAAYPHLPLGFERAWTTEFPSVAHQYDYLMHSMLALAGSHLGALTKDATVSADAVSHRLKAIQRLNSALVVPASSRNEADARVAAMLALTFQAAHLNDALFEFLTMLRGCTLIALRERNVLLDGDSPFNGFMQQEQRMTKLIGTGSPSPANPRHLDDATASLERCEHLLDGAEQYLQNYMKCLKDTVKLAYTHPTQCYITFTKTYSYCALMTNAEFSSFVSPTNYLARILLAHFVAIQQILVPILVYERANFSGVDAPTHFVDWLYTIESSLPQHGGWREYIAWPMTMTTMPVWMLFKPPEQSLIESHIIETKLGLRKRPLLGAGAGISGGQAPGAGPGVPSISSLSTGSGGAGVGASGQGLAGGIIGELSDDGSMSMSGVGSSVRSEPSLAEGLDLLRQMQENAETPIAHQYIQQFFKTPSEEREDVDL